MIFKSKNAVKLPKTILAKTSKIVFPFRRNAEFQEIEVTKNKNYKAQIDEKSYIFWDIDFKSFHVLRTFRRAARRLQNRAQSIPERKKSDQKRQQAQQDAKNAPKTRPRAKTAPTWPQHGKIWTCLGRRRTLP